jgi:hypothetical protein
VFAAQGGQPRVFALRDDFPDTPHRKWTPQGAPCSLCVDDRPWPEAKLTYRPADLIRRIQLWLAKAARGELHDTAQPPDPPDGKITDDLRAVISLDTAGQIGINWGVLANSKAAGVAGADDVFVRAVPEGTPSPADIKIEPAQAHLAFDRELAAAVAGHTAPDRRRAVLVGGGALGSQIAMNMAREGAFSWTVVDSDYLLPHNLARHALLTDELGARRLCRWLIKKRLPSRPSPSARRMLAICAVRFAGSTNGLGHTRFLKSSLLTRSPGLSRRALSISRARLPMRTGLPFFNKRHCVGTIEKKPKEMTWSVPDLTATSEADFRGARFRWLPNMTLAPSYRRLPIQTRGRPWNARHLNACPFCCRDRR